MVYVQQQLSTQGQSVTLVYVDATRGWKNTMDSTSNVTGTPSYIIATGGTITVVEITKFIHLQQMVVFQFQMLVIQQVQIQ
jgi:hypothetical protein